MAVVVYNDNETETIVVLDNCYEHAGMEITGTFQDTRSAWDQVINVFTLRGHDIDAVAGEFDRAGMDRPLIVH